MSEKTEALKAPIKEIELWTIQMAQWRIAKREDIFLLDTTAKSGIPQFAPDMKNVLLYKEGNMSEEFFTTEYHEKMGLSEVTFPKIWERLKEIPRIAIACYCTPEKFCHRHLFLGYLRTYLEEAGINVILKGEITKLTNFSIKETL